MVTNCLDIQTGDGYIILTPSLSMSARGALWVYTGLSVYCLGIGVYFAALGAWFVLPFSGLEVSTLIVTGFIVRRRLSRQEVLRFTAGEVVIEQGVVSAEESWRASRPWSSVVVYQSQYRHFPRKVLVCFRADRKEVGGFLIEDERDQLIDLLSRMLPVKRESV